MVPYRKGVCVRRIHLSVIYSDNEYDVFLGNKPCDMMGLGALVENIISVEFLDVNG